MIMFAQTAMPLIPVGLQVGVGGILCILILRMVFEFVDRQRIKKNGNGPVWSKTLITQIEMQKQIKDLYEWHRPDDSGEQSWKNTRMIKIVQDTNQALRDNTAVMKELLPILRKVAERQEA